MPWAWILDFSRARERNNDASFSGKINESW